jgi:DsbC/DsbD-like thiol-disulfide interchange protein
MKLNKNEIFQGQQDKSMSQSRGKHLLLFLFLCLSLSGCSDRTVTETVKPSPSPGQISSSAQVVKVSAEAVSIAPNSSADAVIKLLISPGFHINANPATFPYLIATEVLWDKTDGITPGKPVYPAAIRKTFQFAEQPLAVYEGEVSIKVPLRATAGPADQRLPIKLRVQACDEEKCYPPVTLDAAIAVTVK